MTSPTSHRVYGDFADVHSAFYDQCALPAMDLDFFRSEPKPGRLLLIGSYCGVLPSLQSEVNAVRTPDGPRASFSERPIICDRSLPMLAECRRRRPDADVVQADVRQLPFGPSFAVVLIPGAVTAHLLTDEDLDACIGSVAAALFPGGELTLDAYAAGTITETPYFNGNSTFNVDGHRWRRIARTLSRTSASLQVVLEFASDESDQGCRELLMQRTYTLDEWLPVMSRHGLHCTELKHASESGRLYIRAVRS